MPQKPLLEKPSVVASFPVAATLIEYGKALERGVSSLVSVSLVSLLSGAQPSRLEGNFLLPWKARLRISSA